MFCPLAPSAASTLKTARISAISRTRPKTAAAKSPQGFTTLGDLGYLDDAGYLYLKDRKSFMMISGGVNIYPQEIEDLLVSHEAVLDAAVFGVPDADFGEAVKAVSRAQPALQNPRLGRSRRDAHRVLSH